jgi:hypothetical protein
VGPVRRALGMHRGNSARHRRRSASAEHPPQVCHNRSISRAMQESSRNAYRFGQY